MAVEAPVRGEQALATGNVARESLQLARDGPSCCSEQGNQNACDPEE